MKVFVAFQFQNGNLTNNMLGKTTFKNLINRCFLLYIQNSILKLTLHLRVKKIY